VSDPHVREVGRLTDLDGSDIVLLVDYNRVVIDYGPPLTQDQAEEFARLFVRACWEAAAQGGAP
jgi:hypothetical protein